MSFLSSKFSMILRSAKLPVRLNSVLRSQVSKVKCPPLVQQFGAQISKYHVVTTSHGNKTFLLPPQFCIRAPCVTMATSPDKKVDPFTKQPFVHPTKGNLVYAGPLSKMMKKVKIFSLSTSVVGISSQLYMYFYSTASFKVLVAVGGFLNIFVFVTPICIHIIARKYITDMFYNKESRTFTAANVSFLLRRKEFEFTPDDVALPMVTSMFTSHIIKGKPYLIQPETFKDDQAYVDMMGYDKPLDMSIKPADVKSK